MLWKELAIIIDFGSFPMNLKSFCLKKIENNKTCLLFILVYISFFVLRCDHIPGLYNQYFDLFLLVLRSYNHLVVTIYIDAYTRTI